MTVTCDYCQRPAGLVTGASLYPHRPDLFEKRFWACSDCEAWVGCHPPDKRAVAQAGLDLDSILEALSEHDDPCEDTSDALARIADLQARVEYLRPFRDHVIAEARTRQLGTREMSDHTDNLPPIERDEQMQREYIPLPGGWELQTKGNGSTLRLLDKKSGERHPIPLPDFVIEFIERMGREVHAALSAPAPDAIDDLLSHRVSWRGALVNCLNAAILNDKSYWVHELEVFDRVFAELGARPFTAQADKEGEAK